MKYFERESLQVFLQKGSVVNAVYISDKRWLQKAAEECLDAALYTNYICLNGTHLVWIVFQYTSFLGRKETKKRTKPLLSY